MATELRPCLWLMLSGVWLAACSFPEYEFAGAAAKPTATEAGAAGATQDAGSRVLGCWAPDQRPWQYCVAADCSADRCKRDAGDSSCEMYRPEYCLGTWPPAGYPGENQ